MNIKSVFGILLLAIVLLTGQADAHLKLALVKAKLAAIKAPHVAAHVAVATDVKFKTVDAFWKSVAAIKATKLAAASIITAPVRVVGKTIALKLAALKAAKALKVATALRVVDSLKRNPIIVPVPVPVKVPFPVLPHHDAIAALGGGPINGLISGAQSILQATGQKLPFLPTLSNGVAQPNAIVSDTVNVQAADLLAQLKTFQYPINVAPEASSGGHQTYGLPSQ